MAHPNHRPAQYRSARDQKNANGLTEKMEAFARLVASGVPPGAAYDKAYPTTRGRKWSTVLANGKRQLKHPAVAARVAVLRAKADAAIVKAVVADAKVVMQEVIRLATSDIGDLFDAKGNPIPIHKLPTDIRRAISSVKTNADGSVEIKLWDKNSALEKAMRHLGLFEKDNAQQRDGLMALRDALLGRVVGVAREVIDMPTPVLPVPDREKSAPNNRGFLLQGDDDEPPV